MADADGLVETRGAGGKKRPRKRRKRAIEMRISRLKRQKGEALELQHLLEDVVESDNEEGAQSALLLQAETDHGSTEAGFCEYGEWSTTRSCSTDSGAQCAVEGKCKNGWADGECVVENAIRAVRDVSAQVLRWFGPL